LLLSDVAASVVHLLNSVSYRAATLKNRVVSTNLAMEIWYIPVNYGNPYETMLATLNKSADIAYETFVVYGIDELDVFGTLVSATGTGKHSEIVVPPVDDSFIFDFFGHIGNSDLVAGPEQEQFDGTAKVNPNLTPLPWLPAHVQDDTGTLGGSSPTRTKTLSGNTTAGNILLAWISTDNISLTQVSSVTDSQGNVWTHRRTQGVSTNNVQLWTAFAGANAALTVSVTFVNSTANGTFKVSEFTADGATSLAVDVSNGADTSAVASHAPGSVTPTQNNTWAICMMGVVGGFSVTGVPDGYTHRGSGALVPATNPVLFERTFATPQATDPTVITSTNETASIQVVVLKKSAGGSTALSLSVSKKESYTDIVNVMRHTANTSGEFIHVAFAVKSVMRRNAAFTEFLESTAEERTILAEIGAAVDDPFGWTAMTALPVTNIVPVPSTATTIASMTVNTDTPTNGILVSVCTMITGYVGSNSPAIRSGVSGITRAGLPLTYFDGHSVLSGGNLYVVELWYRTNVPNGGNVVVTLAPGFTHHSTYANSVSNLNSLYPIRTAQRDASANVVNDGSGHWMGKGAYPAEHGFRIKKDEAFFSALFTNSSFISMYEYIYAVPNPTQWGTSQTVSSRKHHVSSTFWHVENDLAGVAVVDGWFAWIGAVLVPNTSSKIYTYPLSNVVVTNGDRSGIQREFDHVELSGISLSTYPNLEALVASEAGLGGTYFNAATGTVYLRTLSASDALPSTFASVTLEFNFFLSNRLADFVGGRYYDPRLTGVFPSVTAEQGQMLFGAISYPGGTLDVDNRDGFFDTFVNDWYWKNRRVKVFYGGPGLAREQYRQMFTMLIDDVQAGYEHLTFRLRALGNSLQTQVPQQTIGDYLFGEEIPTAPYSAFSWRVTGPNTVGSVSGVTSIETDAMSALVPYRAGIVKGVPGILVYRTIPDIVGSGFPQYSYLIGGSDIGVISNVRMIIKSTGVEIALVSMVDYVIQGPLLDVFREGFDPELHDIVVDCTNDYYVGQVIRKLLESAGVNADEIDSKSFADFDELYPTRIGLYIREQTTVSALIDFVQKSTQCSVSYTQDGIWRLRQWLPSVKDFENLPSLSQSNFKQLPHPVLTPKTPFFEVVVQYGYMPYYDFYEETSRAKLAVIGTHKTIESYFHRTCLIDFEDADLIADRIQALQNAHPLTFEVEETGMVLFDQTVYDRFRLSLDRAPGSATGWDNAVVQILAIEKTLNPEGITLTLDNMHGIGAGVKLAAPDYHSVVMKHAPYAFWRFEEEVGYPYALDTTENDRKLTYQGTYTLQQAGALEEDGRPAVLFNGSTGMAANLTEKLLHGTAAVTFEAWVKGDGAAWSGSHETILNTGNQGNYISVFNGQPYFSLNISGTVRTLSSGVSIGLSSYAHVVGTWRSGDYMRIYVNGVLAATHATAYTGTITETLLFDPPGISIGAFDPVTPSLFFGGTVDEVALYPTALTSDEVGEHYAARLYGRNWDEVQALEKAKYIFVADDLTGRVDVNDPTTKGQSIAW
jgi:hypothetical protein